MKQTTHSTTLTLLATIAGLFISSNCPISYAFTVVVKPPSTITRSSSMQIPAASSSLLAPELEEFSSEKQNNNNDSSWIETKDGGFIPNLRRQVLREQRSSQTQNPWITSVHSLEEYKRVVIDESVTTQTLTVVRFYADWCRACQRIEAPFQRLAQHHHRNNVRFIQVPLTKETAFIHQGLGVPSLPFAHVYHPELGLVEERRISKKYFNDFAKVVDQYVQGSCDVYYSDDDNDDVQNVPSAEEL